VHVSADAAEVWVMLGRSLSAKESGAGLLCEHHAAMAIEKGKNNDMPVTLFNTLWISMKKKQKPTLLSFSNELYYTYT
jgi:hypothetical protein